MEEQGNNGQEPETPIDPVEAKKKAFEENPDNFVHINDLVIALKRSPEPLHYHMLNHLSDVLECRVVKDLLIDMIDQRKLQISMKNQATKIQPATSMPGIGGIRGKINRVFGGR